MTVAKTVPMTPVYGDVLVEASIGDASNLVPMLSSDSASHEIAGYIYNGLVKYDKDYTITGDLAESWTIEKNGRVLRFHLKKGVKWQDNEPFTAKDVMYTYKTICDPQTPTAYAGRYRMVSSARIIDDHTIEFEYEEPFVPALISWSLAIMPAHLLKGKKIQDSTLTRSPVGTGPFCFKKWDTGARIVLEANKGYFDGRPRISGIVYRVIPDQTTQFMELKAGNIDIMGLSPLQYLRQTRTKAFNQMYNKYKYLSDGYTYLGFNLNRPPFDDVRVRQAISYAIDKDEIIKGVLMGLGQKATGPYKPHTLWYNPKVRLYPYNPEKALSMLNNAGYKDHDHDGILDKEGQALEFTLLTNQGNPLRAKTAQIIQQRLKVIGIEVHIRIIEWTVFIKEYINKGRFDAIILGWNILQDPDLYSVWHSSNAVKSGLNFVGYKNREVDNLLEQGRKTFDRKKRKACYDRIQVILAEEQPYVFLYCPYNLPAVNSRFMGIEPAPAGITYNLDDWYVPKALQKYKVVP